MRLSALLQNLLCLFFFPLKLHNHFTALCFIFLHMKGLKYWGNTVKLGRVWVRGSCVGQGLVCGSGVGVLSRAVSSAPGIKGKNNQSFL